MRKSRIKKVNNYLPEHKTLVAQLESGKDEAFKLIIRQYRDKIYRIAYCITQSHPEAEEVLQDVFVAIYKKINSLKDPRSLSSWINRITANFAKMKVREKNRNRNLLNKVEAVSSGDMSVCPFVEPSTGELGSLLDTEAYGVVTKAISELPQKYKSVIVLNDLNDFSLQKTSDLLNISIPAVKSRLHRARKELKKNLKMYFFEGAM